MCIKGDKNRLVKGFTLIELVSVIVVLSIVSVGISGFLRSGFQIYSDVNERDQLLSESRFVVERLNRELRMAIPNSARLLTDTANEVQCLEFVPAQWATFYTKLPVIPDTDTQARVVELTDNDGQYSWLAGDYAFVYPTSSSDVFDASKQKRQTTLSCSDAIDADGDGNPDGDGDCTTANSSSHVAELTLSGVFAEYSPASRLYLGRNSVSFCARSGKLYRHQDTINVDQTLYVSGGDLMVENLQNDLSQSAQLPFEIAQPTLNRNSLVHILLAFELNEEKVDYNFEVHIPNVP